MTSQESATSDTSLPKETQTPQVEKLFVEDPLLKFFSKHGKSVFWTIVIIGVVYYAKLQFEDTYRANMQEAAQSYAKVRAEFEVYLDQEEELKKLRAAPTANEANKKANEKANEKDNAALKPDPAKIEEQEKKLSETERKLKDFLKTLSDKHEPYNRLVPIYQAIIAAKKGDHTQVLAELKAFNWSDLSKVEASERLQLELAALMAARTMLDSDYPQGRSLLTKLVEQGDVVHVSAAISLARVSETAEEKDQARSALNTLLARHPESREFLEEELKRLG